MTEQTNPNSNPNVSGSPAAAQAAVAQDPRAQKAAQEQGKQINRPSSTLITNPAPAVDPDVKPVEVPPSALPQSTIDEMEAGKRALERNRPVAQALEAARDRKPGDEPKV